MKFLVRFNTHQYPDCSDKPRSAYVVVDADTNAEARQIVCDKRNNEEKHGKRYIGLVFDAEIHLRPSGTF